MISVRPFLLPLLLTSSFISPLFATETAVYPPSAAPTVKDATKEAVGLKKAASEDPLITNFHSMGEVANHTNIFRCANPVGEAAKRMQSPEPTVEQSVRAKNQMQHLYDLGVRTVVSLQRQDPPTPTQPNPEFNAVVLEKAAAKEVGLRYVAFPMGNRGKDSFEDMSHDAATKLVESVGDQIVEFSKTGGVAFHCKSGKDRTGLVAGYLRIKYQHWSVDNAIAEMRHNGHQWKEFAHPGQHNSWHEEHLRALAKTLDTPN